MRYLVTFWLCLAGYAVWSYGLADPNLVFTAWQPYWFFQDWMWVFARTLPQWYTAIYAGLMLSLFGLSMKIATWLQTKNKLSLRQSCLWFLLLVSPLLFSYNALSHDVFNYLFNAKMVVVYHTNPHTHTALEFGSDDWTRFMHNTHTPAPYGYGWTAVSLLPYMLGMGKFTWSWLLFRLFSLVSIFLTVTALQRLAQRLGKKISQADLAFFFLNPLVLIEILANSHNDLWMLAPAVFALSVLLGQGQQSFIWRASFSLLLLSFSISIKYATVVLLPVWFVIMAFERLRSRIALPQRLLTLLTQGIWERLLRSLPYIAAILLLLPLTTNQSQQYLPWYLTWSLVWLPLITSQRWRQLWLVFSIAALLRYIPWLLTGGYELHTLQWQKIISWGIPALWLVWQVLQKRTKSEGVNVLVGRTVDA